MSFSPVLLALTALPVVMATPAGARPADNLSELHHELARCARIKSASPAWVGSEITVRFSIRRDGSLIGQPRITYSKLPEAVDEQKAFTAAVLGALAGCFPVDVTPGLGGAVAGRIVTIRIGSSGPGRVRMPRDRF